MTPAIVTPAMDLTALDPLEWVVVGLSAVAAVWVIVWAVKLTLHPGEEEPDHVKRVIFREDEIPPCPPDGPGR